MHPITDPEMADAAAELRALCERLTADLLALTATLPQADEPRVEPVGFRGRADGTSRLRQGTVWWWLGPPRC